MKTPIRQFPSVITFGVSAIAATFRPETSVPSISPLGIPRAMGIRAATASFVFIGETHSFLHPDAAEKLVVVQEVERTQRRQIAPDEVIGRIREAIVSEHEIVPHEIVLLRPGALPKTTSGKIQRNLTRTLWLEGRLDYLTAESAA